MQHIRDAQKALVCERNRRRKETKIIVNRFAVGAEGGRPALFAERCDDRPLDLVADEVRGVCVGHAAPALLAVGERPVDSHTALFAGRHDVVPLLESRE